MLEYAELPDGLDTMAPGPALSALLSMIDPAALNGWQLVEVLAAQQRQVSFEQARLLAVVKELAFTPAGGPLSAPRRDVNKDPFTGTEISFALAVTEHCAQSLVGVALWSMMRVPAVHAALLAGRIDLAKARLICDEVADATDEHAAQVVERLFTVGEVGRCTTTQVRARIRRLLLSLDPDAVRTRHRKAVADRWVQHSEFGNGTAAIAGSYLPVDKAAAAYNHLDAIARATKAAGDPRRLDQIRADVFADLLAGVDPARAGAATPAERKATISLRLDLTTLAMLNDDPGDLDGFGPVLADIARQTAAQLASTAQWRFTITDNVGSTLADGRLTRTAARTAAGITTRLAARAASRAGRDGYRPSAAQEAFVRARDLTCRAPGCTRPAHRCDLDHIRDWATSHETTIANLGLLCRRHHRAKHQGLFRLRRGVHGTDWTTPRGQRYTVLPEYAPAPSHFEHTLAAQLHGHPHHPSRLRR